MKRSFWETLVLLAIILALVQTVLDDLSTLLGWSWQTRILLLWTGFFFDLFFTLEFLTRLYLSYIEGNSKEYFFHQYGWIDLIASLPLLLLSSGPIVFGLLAGGVPVFGLGRAFNLLKAVKAVRVTRVLRLLRTLKIIKHLKHAESVMTQRHTAKIASFTLTTCIATFSVGLIVFPSLGGSSLEQEYWSSIETTTKFLIAQPETELVRKVKELSPLSPYLLMLRRGEEVLFSRHDSAYLKRSFGPYDYLYDQKGGIEVFYDYRPLQRLQAEQNLILFLVVIGCLLLIVLYYAPHFALTVSDPLYVMLRGFKEPTYNLEAKIIPKYKSDEVFKLAEQYNQEYLPLKQRNLYTGAEGKTDLSWEAVSGLFKKE
ncbi:MAG: ion transporter [Spirochaetales bacterium]